MSETAKVDLSLAKPGDFLHRRDGKIDVLKSVHANIYKEDCPYFTENGSSYRQDGTHCDRDGCYVDIVRITSNGVQVTPATVEPVAEVKAASNTGDDAVHTQGCVAQGSPAAVITGPGKYRTKGIDYHGPAGTSHGDWLVEIVGRHEKYWLGFQNGYLAWWADDGRLSHFAYSTDSFPNRDPRDNFSDITGPYVPPPEPVFEDDEGFNKLWDQKQKCLEKIQAIREHDYTVGESALPKVADALESVVDYAAHVFDHITQS